MVHLGKVGAWLSDRDRIKEGRALGGHGFRGRGQEIWVGGAWAGLTFSRRKTRRWCILERTGKPFLLVRKMLVGRMAALIGSPSQRSMT